MQAVLRDCVEEMQGQSMAKKREFLQAPMRRCQALHPEYEVQGEEMHYDPIFFGYPTPGYVSVRIHDTKRHIWRWGSLKVQTQKEADGSYKTIILHGVRD